MRVASVAELVADRLRERIIVGDIADGEILPKQEELLAEFGVSKPSLREALRILEAEGLIEVRRGKYGGSVARRPHASSAALVMQTVLRSVDAGAQDVVQALRRIEPVCAGLCAAREDRVTEVLPRLRAVHDEAWAAVDDLRSYTVLARKFHEELVACCGNQTMILVVGSLERLCSEDSALWIDERLDEAGVHGVVDAPIADAGYRRAGLADHDLLIGLIESGDQEGAEQVARRHTMGRRP